MSRIHKSLLKSYFFFHKLKRGASVMKSLPRMNDSLLNATQYDLSSYIEVGNSSPSYTSYARNPDFWKELDCLDYIKVLAYVVIIIGGLLGNMGVILTVLLNKNMKTTINFYVANLAVADAMICIVCMVPHAIQVMLTPDVYVLGAFMCKFHPFTQMTSLTSSVLTLSAISCDRFVAIMFPLRARITKQRTSWVLTVIWIISILVSVPFLVAKQHALIPGRYALEPKCMETWPVKKYYDESRQRTVIYHPLRLIYYITVSITLFFLPIVIMITAYSLIVWQLWMTKVPGEQHAANLNIHSMARKKVNKMVFVILVVFIICWTPIQIMIVYSVSHNPGLHGPIPKWFSDFKWFSYYIAYGNSCLNPMIYGGFNKTFRDGFCIVFRCGYPRNKFKREGADKSRVTSSKWSTVFSKRLQSMNTTLTSLRSRTETFFRRSKTKVPMYRVQVVKAAAI